MPGSRKTRPPTLQAKSPVEALRGGRSAAEIAKAFDVRLNLVVT